MDSIIQHYAMTHMLHGGENGGRRGRRMGEGGRMHHRSHILSSTRSRSRGSIDEDDDVSFFPSPFKGHRHALSPLPGYSANRFDDGMTLCMQLVDWEHFVREDPISEALMPVKKSQFENKPSFWPKPNKPAAVINKESRGEVNVSLCYSQTSKKLTVVILKARNLPRKDLHAYCDPYVKLCLMHNGNKLDKKKTAVRSQTSNPIFHECFTFIVSNEVIADAQLVVSALDFDFINNNRDIGHVVLGKNGSETGEKHWAEMVTRPGYPTAQWHTLMLNCGAPLRSVPLYFGAHVTDALHCETWSVTEYLEHRYERLIPFYIQLDTPTLKILNIPDQTHNKKLFSFLYTARHACLKAIAVQAANS